MLALNKEWEAIEGGAIPERDNLCLLYGSHC